MAGGRSEFVPLTENETGHGGTLAPQLEPGSQWDGDLGPLSTSNQSQPEVREKDHA